MEFCVGVKGMEGACYYKEDLYVHYTESLTAFTISNIHVSATFIFVACD
jgi:hypothetical protein